ncbi:bone morphogenetic protein 1-like [Ptychodera flava]|uniref:bone morphogenetic protein 1-like n=1 Tax=Ptychodera flava TaxID=63121 RepID=UPI00396A1351
MLIGVFSLFSLALLSLAKERPQKNSGDPCDDDNVVIEGDIAMSADEYILRKFTKHVPRGKRAVTSISERKWPNATVPYKINKQLDNYQLSVINQAIAHWEEHTCIRFVSRTTEEDYVEFARGKCGCCSFVGRRGNGRQQVSVSGFCTEFGVIVHEIGHVIGFWHEHSRPDRDKFVQIHDENIQNDRLDHFVKKSQLEINSFGQAYDYQSIMHYPTRTFTKNGKDTIEPLMHGVKIGQRQGLSQGDVIQARELYQCPKPECNQNLTSSTGGIKSPYFPYNYPKNHECIWIIHAPPDHRIVLKFLKFDVEYKERCSFDYVEIRFGTNSSAPLNDIYCGEETPELVVSLDGAMWIKFHSDKSIVRQGFQASYVIEPIESSGAMYPLSGGGDPALVNAEEAKTTEPSEIFSQEQEKPYSTQAPCEQICLFFHFCRCKSRIIAVLSGAETLAPRYNDESGPEYSGIGTSTPWSHSDGEGPPS